MLYTTFHKKFDIYVNNEKEIIYIPKQIEEEFMNNRHCVNNNY